jgi:tRNA A-37 threonylcarbamoyl transferase component Bud32
MTFTKYDVTYNEYQIQDLIYKKKIISVPEVYDFEQIEGKYGNLTMQKIPELNISDMYGANFSDIPEYIIEECRNIISILYKNHIEYPDITGYNFIEYDKKIWLIDFEHARVNYNYNTYDPFIIEFISGSNSWNPFMIYI